MQVDDRKSISKIRIERAAEFYDDAVALYKENRYRSAASRLYFSVFHAMRAVLAGWHRQKASQRCYLRV